MSKPRYSIVELGSNTGRVVTVQSLLINGMELEDVVIKVENIKEFRF